MRKRNVDGPTFSICLERPWFSFDLEYRMDVGERRRRRREDRTREKKDKKRSSLNDSRNMRTRKMSQADDCAVSPTGRIDQMTCISHYIHLFLSRSLSLALVTRHSCSCPFAIVEDCSLDTSIFFLCLFVVCPLLHNRLVKGIVIFISLESAVSPSLC